MYACIAYSIICGRHDHSAPLLNLPARTAAWIWSATSFALRFTWRSIQSHKKSATLSATLLHKNEKKQSTADAIILRTPLLSFIRMRTNDLAEVTTRSRGPAAVENRGLMLVIRKTGDGVVDPAVNTIVNAALCNCTRVQSMASNQNSREFGWLDAQGSYNVRSTESEFSALVPANKS